jgi:hypothetical protein
LRCLPDFPVWQFEKGLVCGGEDWNGEKYIVKLYAPQADDNEDSITHFSKPIFGFDSLYYENRIGANYTASLQSLLRIY